MVKIIQLFFHIYLFSSLSPLPPFTTVGVTSSFLSCGLNLKVVIDFSTLFMEFEVNVVIFGLL